MIPLATLKTAVHRALRHLGRVKDIREAEVFASYTGHLLCRLNYTSDIPCHGVEEPKSSESFGLGVRAVFDTAEGPKVGFGSEERDLSLEAVRRALDKARESAVLDLEFVSLPSPQLGPSGKKRTDKPLSGYHDRAIMGLTDRGLVEAGWQVIHEALKAYETSDYLAHTLAAQGKAQSQLVQTGVKKSQPGAQSPSRGGAPTTLPALGLIVSGDVRLTQERMAIASTRQPKVQSDEATTITSFVTAMVEREQAKGSGYAATTHLAKFKGEAGGEAARNALKALNGQRLPSGTYSVILGPQPVSDLLTNVLLPSLSANAFFNSQSAFLGEMGRQVASGQLSIYDHGALRGAVGSRALTCEGVPTGRTDLIRSGVLQGLLSNYYETQRLIRDPSGRNKLGLSPQDHPEVLAPRNGFRYSSRGLRAFDAPPSIVPTNIVIEGSVPHTPESLIKLVDRGVYVGRIWYTYPINGLRAGDFTCTVVGDSYLIGGGRIVAPLQANTIRITGNIRHLLQNILGIATQARPIVGWGADAVVYAPDMAVRNVELTEIAQFMESV